MTSRTAIDIEVGLVGSTDDTPRSLKRQLTAIEEEALRVEEEESVQKYTFFNRRLRAEGNRNGDIYDEKLGTSPGTGR